MEPPLSTTDEESKRLQLSDSFSEILSDKELWSGTQIPQQRA